MSLDAIHDICTYLVLNLVNKKYLDDPCRVYEILVYMVANLINGKVELVPWFETWFVNLFGYVFGKMKVLNSVNESIAMTPVVKWDFSLYGHLFDKYEGWTCPSMSVDAKPDIWTYLVLNSVKWNDPWREIEILASMLASLRNEKFKLVNRCPLICTIIFEHIWFCIRSNESIEIFLVAKMRFYGYKFEKWEG